MKIIVHKSDKTEENKLIIENVYAFMILIMYKIQKMKYISMINQEINDEKKLKEGKSL